MNAAGAGVGADEVEDPVAPCEVEVAAAEKVDPGFFEPLFADQEVGDVVCEGGGLELGVVLSVFGRINVHVMFSKVFLISAEQEVGPDVDYL